jgi:tetratricopeptide (TPR) repeat protein
VALTKVRRFEEAIAADQDAAAIYRETGDWHGEATALNNLGLALRQVRRFEEAITARQDAALAFHEEQRAARRRHDSWPISDWPCGGRVGSTTRLPPIRTPPQFSARQATGNAGTKR